MTKISAITSATAAMTLPVIVQKSVRPRRTGPPRPSFPSPGNWASFLSGRLFPVRKFYLIYDYLNITGRQQPDRDGRNPKCANAACHSPSGR